MTAYSIHYVNAQNIKDAVIKHPVTNKQNITSPGLQSFHVSNPVSCKEGLDHAVLLLPLKVLLVEGVDTINHDLDQLDLGVPKTVLVGDVISAAWQKEIIF